MLLKTAKTISSVIRNSDTCARLGNDEFGIILEKPSFIMPCLLERNYSPSYRKQMICEKGSSVSPVKHLGELVHDYDQNLCQGGCPRKYFFPVPTEKPGDKFKTKGGKGKLCFTREKKLLQGDTVQFLLFGP